MKKLAIIFIVFCIALMPCISCTPEGSGVPSETASTSLFSITAANGGTVPAELNGRYPDGTRLEVTAIPDPGYAFYRWVDLESNDFLWPLLAKQNPAELTLYGDQSIIATFRKASELFHLTITADETRGSIAGGMGKYLSGNYFEGSVIGLPWQMRPLPGFGFDKWVIYSSDGEALWTIDQWDAYFTMPPYDVIVMASFKEVPYSWDIPPLT